MNRAKKLLKFIEELLSVPHGKLIYATQDKLKEEVDKDRLPFMLPKHHRALEHYNGDSSHLNNPLRQSRPSRIQKINDHISNMSEVTHLPTKNSFIAYRGSTGIDYHNLKKDDIIHDKGFTSTSLDPGMANQFAHAHHEGNTDNPKMFRLHILAGTKGHFMSAHDEDLENSNEKEFVIHHGTKFRVGDTNQINIDGKTHPITDLHIHSQED